MSGAWRSVTAGSPCLSAATARHYLNVVGKHMAANRYRRIATALSTDGMKPTTATAPAHFRFT